MALFASIMYIQLIVLLNGLSLVLLFRALIMCQHLGNMVFGGTDIAYT